MIDEELADELKVTVVATGLGDTGKIQAIPQPEVQPQEVVAEAQGFDHLDRPAYLRHNAALKQENLAEDLLVDDPDYLDIPAFLRRQAD